MPRKTKRQPDGTRTPWFSEKAEDAHAMAARQVRAVGVIDTVAGRTIVDCDALVGVYFQERGYTLRIIHDSNGAAWYKCGLTVLDGRKYYLLVHKRSYELHTTALINLCEKVQEMWNGTLKPSPDIYPAP